MKVISVVLLTSTILAAQDHPCLILWRQDEPRRILGHDTIVTHWRLLEGEFPDSVKPTNHITSKVVRRVKDAGGKVVEVPVVFSQEDLAKARQQCREETK
jgi:hypothetical protein